jgi:hypothetical protein
VKSWTDIFKIERDVKKYVATVGAEVIGSAMQNFFVTIGGDEIKSFVEEVLDRYQVTAIQNDQWYPHQLSLDVFKLIADQQPRATEQLMALGLAYVETANFPPENNSVLSALTALRHTYYLNIRNVPQSEGYEVNLISPNHIQVKDLNPFPHPTVYGFIWGIAKRFRSTQDTLPVMQQHFMNPDDPDADGALYDILLFSS